MNADMNPTPQYEDRLVLFLDILGFEKAVEESRCDKEGKLLTSLVSALEKLNDGPQLKRNYLFGSTDPAVDYGAHIHAFSDCIAISVQLKNTDASAWLELAASIAVSEVFRAGFLSRGGIAYGPLHHSDKQIVGPALVDAYRLEQDETRLPRVLYSKSALEVVTLISGTLRAVDDDGKTYLDFFEMDLGEISFSCRIKTYDGIIAQGLQTEGDIRDKYAWCHRKLLALAEVTLDAPDPEMPWLDEIGEPYPARQVAEDRAALKDMFRKWRGISF